MGVHEFPEANHSKANFIARLEFEIASDDVTAEHISN